MNKSPLRLFFVVILFFVAFDQKCSNIEKYLELIPEGKINEHCKKFPKDPGTRFLVKMIQFSLNATNRGSGLWDGGQHKPLNVAAHAAAEKSWLERERSNREKLGLPVDEDIPIVKGED